MFSRPTIIKISTKNQFFYTRPNPTEHLIASVKTCSNVVELRCNGIVRVNPHNETIGKQEQLAGQSSLKLIEIGLSIPPCGICSHPVRKQNTVAKLKSNCALSG